MNKATVAQQSNIERFLPLSNGNLQRKCACGKHTGAGGECAECEKKKNKKGLQRKLTIGAINDPLELEADRIADQVMGMSLHSSVSNSMPFVQRYRKNSTEPMGIAPPSVDRVVANSGRSLEPTLQQDMELRFGHDFSRVKVHTDNAAEQSAHDVNAQAYTVGTNIVFGSGQFKPETHEGRRLLAHELTHVVQQTEGFQPVIQRKDAQEQGCDGKVGDIFELKATMPASPPELSTALIDRRNQPNELPKIYFLNDYLNDYMQIVDIPITKDNTKPTVLVMHCETLETLKHKDEDGQSPIGTPSGTLAEPPDHAVEVAASNFGPGTVKVFDECQRVVFEPRDPAQSRREYRLETRAMRGLPEMKVYVPQQGEQIPYSPLDLSSMLKVHLLGDKCGTSFTEAKNESEEEE